MKAREIAYDAVGIALYLIIFILLWLRFTAGQALGLMVVFHLVAIPCALGAWCALAPLPRVARAIIILIAAPLAAGWLAYGIVKHTGTSVDLIDERTPCYDRQDTHLC